MEVNLKSLKSWRSEVMAFKFIILFHQLQDFETHIYILK